jgi:LPS sulfotransferase NodH
MPSLGKAVRHPRLALSRAQFVVASALGHRDYRAFVVLGHARTGSNMLVSMLNSHPNVVARGEVFANADPATLTSTVGHFYSQRMPRRVSALGCKVFYYHPLRDRTGSLWPALAALPSLHVIHLTRRNVLRTVVSRALAEQQDEWVRTHREQSPAHRVTQITMNPETARTAIERITSFEAEAPDHLAGRSVIDVVYEDVVSQPSDAFRRITDFLGVPPAKPIAATVRQNPQPLRELISNYDELQSAFSG